MFLNMRWIKIKIGNTFFNFKRQPPAEKIKQSRSPVNAAWFSHKYTRLYIYVLITNC